MKRKIISLILLFSLTMSIFPSMVMGTEEAYLPTFNTVDNLSDSQTIDISPLESKDEIEATPTSTGLLSFETASEFEAPLISELTIRTTITTTNLSNALLAGQANDSGVAVFDPQVTTYNLPQITDSTTQLRFWFNQSTDVKAVTLHWKEESKAFTATSNQWANCLSPGLNTIRLVVTPNEGENIEYTFIIHSLPTLTALSLTNQGSSIYLNQSFSASNNIYEADVPDSINTLTVNATPKDSTYNLKYNSTSDSNVNVKDSDKIDISVSVDDFINIYTVKLNKIPAFTASVSAVPNDATIMIYDSKGVALGRGLGQATAEGVISANYVVSKYGYITQVGNITDAATINITLKEAPAVTLPSYTGEWTSFRGNPENMGVTSAKTATSAETAILKWAKQYGTGWSAAPTPPLILNNALYIASANKVLKIDIATGEKKQESDTLVANVGFAMNPIAYGGGMFFVPVGQGRVQALNAETLESLWISENLGSSAQTVSPLVYHKGYIYTGVWNKETDPGTYFCLSVTDEDPNSKTETKLATWKFTPNTGFYWAGAYVTDDYLIVGSDDGLPEGTYEETAVLYSLNPKTGETIDSLGNIKGDIRSSIAYSNGTVYFATKGGWFCSLELNANGTFIKDSFKYIDLNGMCTGTPLVYNNRAYIGSSGTQGQFSPGQLNVIDLSGETLTLAYSANLPGYPQASALLSTAYEDFVYVYISYNNLPGGIYAIADKPGQDTPIAFDLFIPPTAMQQYAIASLIADSSGTLYYKNDSGYLMAVSLNEAFISQLQTDVGKLDKEFVAGSLEYELVVPQGTASVNFTLTTSDNSLVTINGEEPAPVTLNDGLATAVITVKKGEATRVYTINIREYSKDTSLSNASANMSNILGGGLSFELQQDKTEYLWHDSNTSNFRRIWVKPTGPNATVKAFAVDGVATSMNGVELAQGTALTGQSIGASTGYSRYNVYFASNRAAATIKVEITAEDGITVKDYFFTVTRPDTYTPTLSAVSSNRISASTAQISFTSTKDGSYYYAVVSKGASEPTIDTTGEGVPIVSETATIININNLNSGAQDVYIKVKDSFGNISSSLKVELAADIDDEEPTPIENIKVSFRLIGSTLAQDDIDLFTNNYQGAKYETWIPTKFYTLAKNSTVYTLFTSALNEASLNYIGADTNYVSTINAPGVLGGYALSEFTNGYRSGWMYTVNGSHPSFGLKEWTLEDGDVVIWHYVNDYSYEVADWFDDDPLYPSLGDGTYFNKWLTALDVEPSAPIEPEEPTPNPDDNTPEEPETNKAIINPNVQADDNGQVSLSVSEKTLQEAIVDSVNHSNNQIIIVPKIEGATNKTVIELPKSALTAMGSETHANLIIETPVGIVTIPNDVLAPIATQAEDDKIQIIIESVEADSLTLQQQSIVGNNPVFDISILSGDKTISSFDGKSITISLPYTLGPEETADNVLVWHLKDDGELEQMNCTYDPETKLATFTTTHLSHFVIGYNSWTNPFTDVTENDWFYEGIKYALQNKIFEGTSATTFSPNSRMTRAMLVATLYRLEGSPDITGVNIFSDVKEDQWYTKAIIWGNTLGIIVGYGNNQFGVNDFVTREQMATVLWRYAAYKNYDIDKSADLTAYVDEKNISPYALKALAWANAEKLIVGRTSDTIAPQETATRAEASAILMRFAESIKN